MAVSGNNRPNVNSASPNRKWIWWALGALAIIGLILGLTLGLKAKPSVSVSIRKCADGGQPGVSTPGFGTNKQSGCECSKDGECASGSCPSSWRAAMPATGFCA